MSGDSLCLMSTATRASTGTRSLQATQRVVVGPRASTRAIPPARSMWT
jgi:hypothetical protein